MTIKRDFGTFFSYISSSNNQQKKKDKEPEQEKMNKPLWLRHIENSLTNVKRYKESLEKQLVHEKQLTTEEINKAKSILESLYKQEKKLETAHKKAMIKYKEWRMKKDFE